MRPDQSLLRGIACGGAQPQARTGTRQEHRQRLHVPLGSLSQHLIPDESTLPQCELLELKEHPPNGVVPQGGPTRLAWDELGLLRGPESSQLLHPKERITLQEIIPLAAHPSDYIIQVDTHGFHAPTSHRQGLATHDDFVDVIRSLRPDDRPAPETDEQIAFVRDYAGRRS